MGTFNSTLFNQGSFGSTPQDVPVTGGVTVSQLTPVNSTTYIDLVGVMMGLTRDTGETSDRFAMRLQAAARSDRGMLNELRLRLGLEFQAAISVESAWPFTLNCSISGIELSNISGSYTLPLLTIDPDNVWVWKSLSQVAAAIHALPGYTASFLAVNDGPALQLVRQSNTLLSVGEAVNGSAAILAHSGLIQGSELFSTLVPSYRYGADGVSLYFDQPVADGVTVTYQYRQSPFSLITCSAAILALADPDLAAVAVTPDNQLTYQAKEFIQAAASTSTDLSYWAV